MLSTSSKSLWVIAALLVVAAIAEQFALPNIIGLERAIYNSSALIMLAVISVIIGLAIALLPIDGLGYTQKLHQSFLLSLIVCSGITDVTFGSLMFKDSKHFFHFGTRKDYKETQAATGTNCKDLLDGTFEDENLVITRNGSNQVQTYKKSHRRDMMRVHWIADCEYELIPLGNPKAVIHVKVTTASKDGYTCVASSNGEMGREYIYKRTD